MISERHPWTGEGHQRAFREIQGGEVTVPVHAVQQRGPPPALGDLCYNMMMMMMMIASHRSHTIEDLKSAFPQSFDTLGKIREEYHLTVDPTVAPVVHPCR